MSPVSQEPLSKKQTFALLTREANTVLLKMCLLCKNDIQALDVYIPHGKGNDGFLENEKKKDNNGQVVIGNMR